MGNAKSASVRSDAIRVLVVGLHDSGKSHFIKTATCDTATKEEEDRPTFGVYESSTMYRRRRITFCEMPPSSLYLLPSYRHQSVVIWFVDAHDTLTEVYDGRNIFLHIVNTLAADDDKNTRVCLVQNIGRPHSARRRVVFGRYAEADTSTSPVRERPVEWERLLDIFHSALPNDDNNANRFATQISYKDAKAPLVLMDWIAGFI